MIVEGAKFCEGCGTKLVEDNTVSTSQQRVTVYEGVIKKCPQCGKPLESSELFCLACGWEKRNIEVSTETLFKKIEIVEENFELDSREKMQKVIAIVRNFNIPNNIEDIYNFLDAAKVRKDYKYYGDIVTESEKELAQAWAMKYEEAYRKGERLAGARSDFKRFAEEKRIEKQDTTTETTSYYEDVDSSEQPVNPEQFKKSKIRVALISLMVIAIALIASAFGTTHIVSGIMGIFMLASTIVAYLMYKGKIKVSKRKICKIPLIAAILFLVAFVVTMNVVI